MLRRSNPHVFEISAWPWLERLTQSTGRLVSLANVPPAEWDRIAAWGFDCVFLMGVWRRSAIGRGIARTHPGLVEEYTRVLPGWTPDDVAGSPYCIQSYEPDERMGGWPGLDAARRELGNRHIALMLDFVPNHTGFDFDWIQDHPERYVAGTEDDYRRAPGEFRPVDVRGSRVFVACGRDPFFPPWTDVAQLNYCNPDTRAAMTATLRSIAEHCDGVRCDMAMLVLNDVFERTWRRLLRDIWPVPTEEFWIEATRHFPQLTFVAEVYWNLEGRLLDQGFTFAYDKRLLDALHAHDASVRVHDVLSAPHPDAARLARFLENHDEPRSAAVLRPRLAAAGSLVATGPGMRLFYDGQLEGRRVRAPVQLGRWPDEDVDGEISGFYARLLRFAREPLLHDGEWRLLRVFAAGDDSFNQIVAYRWRSADALAIIVANPGASASQAHVEVVDQLLDGERFDFADALSGARYPWTRAALASSGLYVRLEAGGAHLFNVFAER